MYLGLVYLKYLIGVCALTFVFQDGHPTVYVLRFSHFLVTDNCAWLGRSTYSCTQSHDWYGSSISHIHWQYWCLNTLGKGIDGTTYYSTTWRGYTKREKVKQKIAHWVQHWQKYVIPGWQGQLHSHENSGTPQTYILHYRFNWQPILESVGAITLNCQQWGGAS